MPVSARGWPTRDVLRVVAVVAGVYLALRLLWEVSSLLLLAFLGVLFGLALSAGVFPSWSIAPAGGSRPGREGWSSS